MARAAIIVEEGPKGEMLGIDIIYLIIHCMFRQKAFYLLLVIVERNCLGVSGSKTVAVTVDGESLNTVDIDLKPSADTKSRIERFSRGF